MEKKNFEAVAKKAMFKVRNNKIVGKSTLYLKKYSPEILMGVGIISIVSGTVMACRATLKVDDVLEEAEEKRDKIEEVYDQVNEGTLNVTYDEKTMQKDKAIVYVQTGVKLVELYLPAVGFGVFGVGCILSSHNILQRRNVALMAAYEGLEKSFKYYRDRVVEEYGEDIDRDFASGIRREKVTETVTDKNGKKKKVEKDKVTIDSNRYSQYARFFDEYNPYWNKRSDYNLIFLRSQQNYANDMLKSRGHIFLNEVYDLLGIPRSQAGALVGWVLNGDGDNYVDFGVYDINNEKARDFVNGIEPAILLDFNVDGVIYDLI